jgi:ferredoxin
MKRVEVLSYPVSIFMAGDPQTAKIVAEEYCTAVGLCVTVTPTEYVHRDDGMGGRDGGFIVGLINYPRFPAEPRTIWHKADELAKELRQRLRQQSYTIQAPDKTVWFSHRPEDTPESEIARLGGVA